MTSNATTFIGCRLPTGLEIDLPGDPAPTSVYLKGQDQARTFIPSVGFQPGMIGVTEIPADGWAAWKAAYMGGTLLDNKLLIEGLSVEDVERQARVLAGLEQPAAPAASTAPAAKK